MASTLIVVLAACSDNEKTNEPATTSASGVETTSMVETTPAETAPPLVGETKLMVIIPETDPVGVGSYPEVGAGARAAAAMINAAGGLNGTEIVVDVCDTKTDPNEAVNCAQRAVDGGYLAVVGGQESSSTYIEPLAAGGVPNVLPYAGTPVLKDPNSFTTLSSVMYLVGGITGLVTPDVTTIAIVYIDAGTLGGQLAGLTGVMNISNPDLKFTMVPISPNQGDYSPIVTTAAEADAIYLAMPSDPIVQFMQTAKQLGVDKPVGVPSATVQGKAMEDLGNELAEGLNTVAAYRSSTTDTNDQIEAFRAAMAEYEPDSFVSDLSANAYTGVVLIATLLEGEAEISSAVLLEKLKGVDGLDLGLLGPIQFVTPSEDFAVLGTTSLFNVGIIRVTVQDGKLVPIGGYINMMTGAPLE